MPGRARLADVYGYLVCLVVVITFLVSLGNLVAAVFDLIDPLHASGTFQQQRILSSLGNYRMDVLSSLPEGQPAPEEASIQMMYEAARDAQVRSVRLRSMRNSVVSGLLIAVSVVIFITHWRWLRRSEAGTRPQVPP